jgi:TRAP-type C4-dicarboxylate transport system permease small subunit
VRFLFRIHRFLIALENTLLLILILGELGMMFAQVVARFFGGGWLFIEELSRYLVLWIGVFGALVATRGRRQIAIEILPRLLKPPLRRILFIFQDLFVLGIVVVLTVATWQYMGALGEERSPSLNLSVKDLLYPLFLGFIFLGLRTLLSAIGVYEEEAPLQQEDF